MTWQTKPLGELARFAMGQAPPKSETNDRGEGTPFYRSGEFTAARPLTRIWTTKPLRIASADDVFVCVVGANSGDVNLGADGAIGRSVAAITPGSSLDQQYLFRFLQGQQHRLNRGAQGSAQGVITKADLAAISVPLPDLSEQRRIVDLIDEHLSHLEAADAALAQANLRSKALLSAALARAAHGPSVPLPQLGSIQGGLQKTSRRVVADGAGAPFLRVANVTAAGLNLAEVHRIAVTAAELQKLRLRDGDLLVVEGNGSASQIGRAAIWDGSIPDCVHQNHLIRVRPDPTVILPEYLEIAWNAPETRAALAAVASSSSGLYTLSVSKLRAMKLPTPSLPSQRDSVARTSSIRDGLRRLAASQQDAGRHSAALRRAILSAAFSGRLTGHSSDTDVLEELANPE